MGLAAWLAMTIAVAGGWRGDGTGVFADAAVSGAMVSGPQVTWRTPIATVSNGTPVLAGGLVCTTAEPTTLQCHDAATGALRWAKTNDYVDTLAPLDMAAHYQKLAQLASDEAAFEATRREVSDLRRQLRYADAPADAAARLEGLTARMEALRKAIDAMRPYLTPPDKEVIGYASPTPWSDGKTMWALFGNGVLSSFNVADGKRLWSRWLGPSGVDMRGYHMGISASVQLVDGALVVPYGKLRGVNPATGADTWKGREYRDFGTPAVIRLAGVAWLLLPTGEAVRARDGVVGATGLGELMYKGPAVSGDRVWFMGGVSESLHRQAGHLTAAAWRLTSQGDTVTAEALWKTDLPTVEAFYAQPMVLDGRLYSVDRTGELWVLDAATGAVRSRTRLGEPGLGDAYAPIQVAGGKLVLGAENGRVLFLQPGDTPAVVGSWTVGPWRSAMVFSGGSAYARTLSHLMRYDG
jgi:outer membrane protein assembly factor BamB